MKKLLLLAVLGIVLVSCGTEKQETNNSTETVATQEVKEEKKFENFAYYKNDNDRHFQVYTKINDKDTLIEEARMRAWTEGKVTIVSFWSSKDDSEVPYLTLAKNKDIGLFMENVPNLNPEKLIGVYFKDIFGNESWFKDSLYLKESLTAEEIEESKLK